MSCRLFLLSLLFLPLVAIAQVSGTSILLIAGNKMQDPRFKNAVVLVTRHGRSPPIGVIVNRPTEAHLGKLFPSLPEDQAKRPLYFGGPVATNQIAFLFRGAGGSADAITVAPSMHLGRAGASLRRLLRGEQTHHGLKVFAGHAAWANGQLEKEIERGDWYTLPLDEKAIFDWPTENIWPELFRRASLTFAATSPVHSTLPLLQVFHVPR